MAYGKGLRVFSAWQMKAKFFELFAISPEIVCGNSCLGSRPLACTARRLAGRNG